MIKIDHLVKNYGNFCAVDDVSFEIGQGEIVGLLGPNGAGKSTTMNILTGYLSSTFGSVEINGLNVLDNPLEAKKLIGYLPEQPPLYLDMTVEEYLNFTYDLKGCTLNRVKHIEEVCNIVKINDVFKRLIGHLSKGYRQRVGIAQALVGDPELLILDEPTVGLDPMQIIDIRNVISELGKKKTLFISSHILSEISAVCDRVLIINKGKIVAEDTPDNLAAPVSGKNQYVARIDGAKEDIEAVLSSLVGIERFECKGVGEENCLDYIIYAKNGADIRRELFREIAAKDMAILMFKSYDVSLEDIFITLTAKEGGNEE